MDTKSQSKRTSPYCKILELMFNNNTGPIRDRPGERKSDLRIPDDR